MPPRIATSRTALKSRQSTSDDHVPDPQQHACSASCSPPLLFFMPTPRRHSAALQHGRVDEAEQTLRTALATAPGDAYAHQLLCRVFYAQEQADKAVAECEAAVAAAPNNSVNLMWLARAYGQKASHAGPIAGYSLGKKAGQTFKRAVEADPCQSGRSQ